MEVTNRFKELGLIECLKNYGQRFVTLYRRWTPKPCRRKRNTTRQNDCLKLRREGAAGVGHWIEKIGTSLGLLVVAFGPLAFQESALGSRLRKEFDEDWELHLWHNFGRGGGCQ